MRLIGTLKDEALARQFSGFLSLKNIQNEIELAKNSDWGSSDYASPICRVWVIDEDDLEVAEEWWALFDKNPQDPRFTETASHLAEAGPVENVPSEAPPPLSQVQKKSKILLSRANSSTVKPLGPVTFYLLITCSLIFLFGQLTKPPIVQPMPNLPYTAMFSPKIDRELMYDFPHAFDLIEKVDTAYGTEKLAEPSQLPAPGQALLQKFYQTSFWTGYYPIIAQSLKAPESPPPAQAPMFEKIKEGEVWRLFTPALLHSSFFHLFFNMIWLLVLGRLMEDRVGAWRLLLFILLTAIASNTAQYLMSGSNFIGFSGVVCGMVAFIWVRQQKSPWEGYTLQASTIAFIAIFVVGMFLISLVSFILEVTGSTQISPNIANTAHISGAISGYLLGRLNYFRAK